MKPTIIKLVFGRVGTRANENEEQPYIEITNMKADTSKTLLRPTLNRIIPRIGEQIEATMG
jgi:hypothetical protein